MEVQCGKLWRNSKPIFETPCMILQELLGELSTQSYNFPRFACSIWCNGALRRKCAPPCGVQAGRKLLTGIWFLLKFAVTAIWVSWCPFLILGWALRRTLGWMVCSAAHDGLDFVYSSSIQELKKKLVVVKSENRCLVYCLFAGWK